MEWRTKNRQAILLLHYNLIKDDLSCDTVTEIGSSMENLGLDHHGDGFFVTSLDNGYPTYYSEKAKRQFRKGKEGRLPSYILNEMYPFFELAYEGKEVFQLDRINPAEKDQIHFSCVGMFITTETEKKTFLICMCDFPPVLLSVREQRFFRVIRCYLKGLQQALRGKRCSRNKVSLRS